ncbi:MAG: hypothetical protein WCX71_05895 [Candidatus Buchananbacteria bacterium]
MIEQFKYYYFYFLNLPPGTKLAIFFSVAAVILLKFRRPKDFVKKTKSLSRDNSIKSFWLYLDDEQWPRDIFDIYYILRELINSEKKKGSSVKIILKKVLLKILYWLKFPIYMILGTMLAVLIFVSIALLFSS